jgi:hypothetical protein
MGEANVPWVPVPIGVGFCGRIARHFIASALSEGGCVTTEVFWVPVPRSGSRAGFYGNGQTLGRNDTGSGIGSCLGVVLGLG